MKWCVCNGEHPPLPETGIGEASNIKYFLKDELEFSRQQEKLSDRWLCKSKQLLVQTGGGVARA